MHFMQIFCWLAMHILKEQIIRPIKKVAGGPTTSYPLEDVSCLSHDRLTARAHRLDS